MKFSNTTNSNVRRLLDYLNRPDFGAVTDNDYDQVFAPFSYAGGKRLNVMPVWSRFGVDVANYIEPFMGGGAIFFGRPPNTSGKRRRELINDECSLLINAYRAMKYAEPEDLAEICLEPYFESDLIGWNRELIRNRFILRGKILEDVRYFDPELAGRWVWVNRGWIGGGACDPNINVDAKMIRSWIAGWHNGSANEHFLKLKRRFSETQTFCGGYERAIDSFTQTGAFGTVAMLMDPPYSPDFCSKNYVHQLRTVAWEAFERALEMGKNPNYRIGYCGYKRVFGARFAAAGWEEVKCLTLGGFGNLAEGGRGRSNSRDEYIWFSPHCLKA